MLCYQFSFKHFRLKRIEAAEAEDSPENSVLGHDLSRKPQNQGQSCQANVGPFLRQNSVFQQRRHRLLNNVKYAIL